MSVFQSWGKTDQTAVKGGFVTRVGPWLSKARRLLGVQFLSVVTRDLGVCPEPESSFQLQGWRRKWQSTPVFYLGNPMDRGAWQATVHGVQRVGHDLAIKQQQLQAGPWTFHLWFGAQFHYR